MLILRALRKISIAMLAACPISDSVIRHMTGGSRRWCLTGSVGWSTGGTAPVRNRLRLLLGVSVVSIDREGRTCQHGHDERRTKENCTHESFFLFLKGQDTSLEFGMG
jgi:hypothetical protein